MTRTLAFYGAGDRARPYLDALARTPDMAVAGVCDPDRRAAEQAAAGWQARVFLSCEAMLDEVRPDALWVCVPPRLQGGVLARAAEQGVPFFVEPPGAADFEHARLVARKVAGAKLVTAVGFPTRHTDVLQEAREYLGAHQVPLALGWWLSAPGPDGAASAAGALWDDAAGMVDALRYFCGEVEQVHALAPAGTEGGLVVQVRFAGGAVGLLTVATFARPEPRVELEMLGEGWSLRIEDGLASLRLVERDRTTILRRLNAPAADHAAAFLRAVAARDPSLVPTGYAEALATLTVCHAAAVSARDGRPVSIAEMA